MADVSYPPISPLADIMQYSVPVSASTVVCSAGTTLLLLNPAGTLAALTVTLPPSPADGQRLTVASSAVITILTVNGGTVQGAITSLPLNGYFRLAFSSNAGAWFRTG